MPRTSMNVGGIGVLLRALRRQSDRMVELLGESIGAHAEEAASVGWSPRKRLIEFGSEGERGPPGWNKMV